MSISATSGVVSNIDYSSLIQSLVSVRRQSVTQLEADKKTLEKTRSAYGTLSTKVQELKTAADALRTATGFKAFTASSSDTNLSTATASSSASAGTYSLKITTIARAHKIAANGVAAETSTVAAAPGVFEFKVGAGAVQSVAVDATTTLSGLRDSINGLKAGVTAAIVNDGAGATPYRLILTSDKTGTANGVTITTNNTSLNFATTLQAAVDATFNVDGLNYTRSSNTVADVITGVTLDFKGEDPAKTVNINVVRDTEDIKKKVTAFMDKYNATVSYIKANNRYDRETKTAGAFFSDSVARSVLEDLRKAMNSAVAGLPDTMNRLQHIGIKSDKEGVLSLDSSKLSAALSSNFDGVVNLFVKGASTTGFGELLYNTTNQIDDFVDGRIKGRQKGLDKNINYIKNNILNKERSLAAYEDQLRSQFTGLETMLAGMRNQGNFLSSL